MGLTVVAAALHQEVSVLMKMSRRRAGGLQLWSNRTLAGIQQKFHAACLKQATANAEAVLVVRCEQTAINTYPRYMGRSFYKEVEQRRKDN